MTMPESGSHPAITRRWKTAYAITFSLLILVLAGRTVFLQSIRSSWPSLQGEVDSTLAADLSRRFHELADRLASDARRLGTSIDPGPLHSPDSPARIDLMESLIDDFQSSGTSVEVRDRHRALVGYVGRSLDLDGEIRDSLQDTVLVHASGPRAFLVSRAIIRDRRGTRAGSVDVAYPLFSSLLLSNRFTASDSFRDQVERDLGIDVILSTTPDAGAAKDGRYLSVPLTTSGTTVGHAYVLHTDPNAYAETVGLQFNRVAAFLAASLLLVLILHGFRIAGGRDWTPGSVCTLIVSLWVVRGLIILLDLDVLLLPAPMLDPRYYASSFGFGLTRSIGATTLTLLTLLCSTALLARMRMIRPGPVRSRIIAIVLLALLPLLLRGYFASLRGFVFDSSFIFDDIQSIFDRPMFWLMLGNVLLLAAALVGFLAFLRHLLRHAFTPLQRHSRSVISILLPLLAGFVILLAASGDLLVSPAWYAGILAAFLLFALRLPDWMNRDGTRASALFFAVIWVTAVLSASPWMSAFIDDKRRTEIEAIGGEIALPTDIWSRVLVDDALQQIRATAGGTLFRFEPDQGQDVRQAFALWSDSPLSGQGSNSAVVISDGEGRLLSRFAVGISPDRLRGAFLDSCLTLPDDSAAAVREAPVAGGFRFYAGSTRMPAEAGIARVTVIVEARDRTVPAQGEVDILRNAPSRGSLAPEDRLALCRFDRGRMVSASDPSFPKWQSLPGDVRRALATNRAAWGALALPDPRVALFLRTGEDPDSSIACIVVGSSNALFDVFRLVRTALFFGVPVLLGFVLAQARRMRMPGIRGLSVATILQLSFISVAAIPVVLIWAGAKSVVAENNRRQVAQQLRESVNILRAGILAHAPGLPAHEALASIDDEACFQIASMTGKELNVYRGAVLAASNRPELYVTGLLESRCDARAFVRLTMLRQDFAMTEERIGDFSYQVGYAAIRNVDGGTEAILSTPTLFEQWRIEEEYTRASAIIFLGSALVIVLVLVLSRVVAAQVARPVRALTDATRDIAAGNFDRRVDTTGPLEMELLRHSFNLMTEQVQQSRRELAAAERELAWREMARQVAHEIRNPLTPIKLAAQHLRKAWEDGAENFGVVLTRLTNTITEQITTLARISDEFSSFARMPRRTLTETNAGELLAEAAQLFQHHAQIDLRLDIPERLPTVRADRDELRRAFINVIKNAVQSIHVRGSIAVTAAVTGQDIAITISDTGSGIAPELLPRVFEPNFSTRTEGMGLGLAITKKIIEDLDGSIAIESEQETGTTVRIVLPASD